MSVRPPHDRPSNVVDFPLPNFRLLDLILFFQEGFQQGRDWQLEGAEMRLTTRGTAKAAIVGQNGKGRLGDPAEWAAVERRLLGDGILSRHEFNEIERELIDAGNDVRRSLGMGAL